MEATDSNVQKFLAERRININDLSMKARGDGTESAKEKAQRQREFAIQKRVRLACFKIFN